MENKETDTQRKESSEKILSDIESDLIVANLKKKSIEDLDHMTSLAYSTKAKDKVLYIQFIQALFELRGATKGSKATINAKE